MRLKILEDIKDGNISKGYEDSELIQKIYENSSL